MEVGSSFSRIFIEQNIVLRKNSPAEFEKLLYKFNVKFNLWKTYL